MELGHVRRTGKAIGGFSIHDRETYHISLRVEGVKLYGIERDAEWDRGCYSGRSEGPYELAPAHGAACLLDALGLFCAPSLARPIYLDAGKENFGRDREVPGCGLAPRFEGTFTEANRLVISSPFWAGDSKDKLTLPSFNSARCYVADQPHRFSIGPRRYAVRRLIHW